MFLDAEQTASLRYSVMRGSAGKFQKKDLVGTKVVKRKEENKEQPKKGEIK